MNIFTEILILFSISYFIGSIPFGLILTNWWGYGDIRKIGSGNIGATNALRTGNKILALLVLLLDAFKSLFLIILFKYFELTNDELIACNDLIKKIKQEVKIKDKSVVAFNVGTNIGKVSGQSIMHCHIHLIPRRVGDVENPQGGVRAVIPKKQHYKQKL